MAKEKKTYTTVYELFEELKNLIEQGKGSYDVIVTGLYGATAGIEEITFSKDNKQIYIMTDLMTG